MPSVYGSFAALGCAIAVWYLHQRRREMDLPGDRFWAAMWTLLLGGVLGAKAGFLALGWEHYARGELRFFADFDTGFVFFGGLAGAALAGAGFARWRGVDFVSGADSFAVALPLGHAVGRIGCFLEGCCHGIPGHPVQLYEAGALLATAWAGRYTLRAVDAGARPRGDAFRFYLLAYGFLRLALDPLRGDGRPERLLGLSHQQGFALGLIALATIWFLAQARGPAAPPRARGGA